MKLNLIEWNTVVEALRIAVTASHAARDAASCTPADNKKYYVKAQKFGELALKIESAERS